jgi:hypothetical protein
MAGALSCKALKTTNNRKANWAVAKLLSGFVEPDKVIAPKASWTDISVRGLPQRTLLNDDENKPPLRETLIDWVGWSASSGV